MRRRPHNPDLVRMVATNRASTGARAPWFSGRLLPAARSGTGAP
jgi:hypothetical protein